jgi:hypothetical protein
VPEAVQHEGCDLGILQAPLVHFRSAVMRDVPRSFPTRAQPASVQTSDITPHRTVAAVLARKTRESLEIHK